MGRSYTFFQCTRKKKDMWEIERRRNKTVPGSENPISTIFRHKFLINLTVDMTQILSLFTISQLLRALLLS